MPMNLAIGVGIGFGGAAPSLDPASAALIARFSTPPTAARSALINTFIVALKNAGVWSKLDALYVIAAADSQAAARNWIADQYNLTVSSAPVFVADRGYTGDGVDDFLDSSFNPTTAVSPKFTQNSACMGIRSRTDLTNGTTSGDIGNGNSGWGRSTTTSGLARGRPNTAGNVNIATTAYPGHITYTRSAAAVWEGYDNGVDVGGGVDASAALTNANFAILRQAAGAYGINQIALAYWGSNLTSGEVAALYAAENAYMTAVGAV